MLDVTQFLSHSSALAHLFPGLGVAFFAILFLQSGVDKVIDRKGNLDWLTGHFANSPLKGQVSMLLSTVTVIELGAGLACAAGAVMLFFGDSRGAQLGMGLSMLALLMLFTGQRLAKDYPGAVSLATYFALALLVTLYLPPLA